MTHPLTRRATLMLASVLALLPPAAAAEADRKPNLLFIFGDDLCGQNTPACRVNPTF